MNFFVLGYFALLIGASSLAAIFKHRSIFMLMFSLTLASFILAIVGGAPALRVVTFLAGGLALAAGVSYSFREFLIALAPKDLARELRTAPLTAAFGMFVIFTYAIIIVFAPLIAPFGQFEDISSAFAPADDTMLLGADQLGRDMFSRILFGIRNSVGLALSATLMAFVVGAVAGLLAATKGGLLDQVFGRVADIIMSVPSLIFALLMLSIFAGQSGDGSGVNWGSFGQIMAFTLALGTLLAAAIARSTVGLLMGVVLVAAIGAALGLAIQSVVPANVITIVIVVAVIYSPRVFRLTRAVAGNVVVMDYIEAAKLRGEGTWYLIRREILPNSTAPLVAEFGLEFCFVFLLLAGLSFLGLGLEPRYAELGQMVKDNATLISFGDITPLIPAAAIALLTVAVNFVVDWMLHRSSGLKD